MEKITPERMKELFKLRSEGKITLNKARKECGLPPIPGGDVRVMLEGVLDKRKISDHQGH